MLAWHFVGKTLRDGSPVPPDGKVLRFKGKTVMCERGLHASTDPWDALRYAPGPILCRVKCGGEIIKGDDKLVCTERTIIRRLDATEGLRYFARMQALSASHLWEAPDVVLDYLLTGDESLRDAARAAARDAAGDATWAAGAAGAAAWAAARDAAWAAGDAARAAARAAGYAAWAAARDAAWAAGDAGAAGAAAWAAGDAAWAAARDAAKKDWNALVEEAFA